MTGNWYVVTTQSWVQAGRQEEAVDIVLARLGTSREGPIRLAVGGKSRELSPEAAEQFLDFMEKLDQAARDEDAGPGITDARWPNLRFTPQAAAQLAAMEFEAGLAGPPRDMGDHDGERPR